MYQNIPALFLFISLSFLFACEQNLTEQGNKTKQTLNKDTIQQAIKESLVSTPTTTKADRVYGIDVSQFQGDEVALLNKQQDSLSFIICKATEGITYTDPRFTQNWKLISSKGFIRGAYHFYRSADAPSPQAQNYINAIKGLQKTDLPPIIDFEGAGIDTAQSVKLIQKNLLAFIQAIEKGLNRKPMIYTDIPTGNKYLDNPVFAEYALWIALYEERKEPILPIAWQDTKWLLWQKTSDYQIDDQKNDFDVFNGSLEELQAFIGTY